MICIFKKTKRLHFKRIRCFTNIWGRSMGSGLAKRTEQVFSKEMLFTLLL